MTKAEARHLARLAAEVEELRKENARLSGVIRSLITSKVTACIALAEIKAIVEEVEL
jgi:hypothetical protein